MEGLIRYLTVMQTISFFIGVIALVAALYLMISIIRAADDNDGRNEK